MNVEDLIKESVDTVVQQVPARPGVARDAMRRARRQRAVIATVAGVAVVAVAAGGAVAAGQFAPDGASRVEPADLPSGEPYHEPAWMDVLTFNKNEELGIDANLMRARAEFDGGIVAIIGESDPGPENLYRIDDEGHPTLLVELRGNGNTVAASDGGVRVAWDEGGRLRALDSETGEVLVEKQAAASVVGFLGESRVITQGKDGLGIWDLGENAITPWLDYDGVVELSHSDDVGAFYRGEDGVRSVDMVDTGTGEVLWRDVERFDSDGNGFDFSPDGRYVVGWVDDKVVVVDARSGDEIVKVSDFPVSSVPTWETSERFVFGTPWEGGSRWVRCDVEGECEFAGKAIPVPSDTGPKR